MAGVPEGNPKDDAKSSRRLLCLSGGGYRGLFTAIVLENIEARLQSGEKRLLRDHFDLVAGTSIGGLLAVAPQINQPCESRRSRARSVSATPGCP